MRLAISLSVVLGASALFLAVVALADGPAPGTSTKTRPAASGSARAGKSSPPHERAPLWAQSPKVTSSDQPRRVVIDRVVAVVGREIITLTELRHRALPAERASYQFPVAQQIELSRKVERDTLDQMIDDILIANVAVKKAITVTETELDAAVEKIQSDNGLTREALLKAVAESHMTEEEYRIGVRRQLLRYKVVQAVIVPRTVARPGVTPDEWAKLVEAELRVWSAEQRVEALVEVRL